MTKKSYLCIHGHFYQPPRENPWIEEIETQDHVGGGYHDWNERISWECYRPNALARILDSGEQIEDIINNFELISFNIGPTLLSWLEKHDKGTYDRIIEADKKSAKGHNGHGNALAQGYNHMIMPLATRRDKVTQVKWGIADFTKRFGRQPEGLWLPETACNEETLEVLVEEGIKFTILSPHQAEKIKSLSDSNWSDVSHGNIDPTRAYRCFLNNNSGKHIDIFFYDGPVSKAVAFDDLLYDAKIYANRLEQAKNPLRKHAELINIATDGETYGHHKLYGDRVLAYLLRVEAPKRGFIITNYGEYLEKFPPEYEVKMRSGENGLGTSWSCPHGVKRWMEHCGCRGGGDSHWRQDWRKPLREAFDWLREQVGEIFTKEGSRYFKDPWEARHGYVQIVLERSADLRREFFHEHSQHNLSPQEIVQALKLLEMQRNAMLMYTSCGWFFTELSGEETVQVIKYATRALQLAENVSGQNLASEFSKRLSEAKSNSEFFKDGLGVFDYLIRPTIATLEKVVSHFAISSLFRHRNEKFKVYCYELSDIDSRKETTDDLTIVFGHVKVRSTITLEEIDAAYALLQSELYDFYCYVRPYQDIKDYFNLRHELFSEFALDHRNRTGKVIYDHFGTEYFSLRDLFKEEKRNILEALSKDGLDRFQELYEEIYEKHKRMIDVCRMAKIPLPEEFQFVVEHKLSSDFNRLITERIFSHPDVFDKAYTIRAWAKESGLKLNRVPSQQYLTKKLNKHMADLSLQWDSEKVKNCHQITKVAQRLGIDIDKRMAQENYFTVIAKLECDPAYLAAVAGQGILDFIDLGGQLAINMERFKASLQKLLINPT